MPSIILIVLFDFVALTRVKGSVERRITYAYEGLADQELLLNHAHLDNTTLGTVPRHLSLSHPISRWSLPASRSFSSSFLGKKALPAVLLKPPRATVLEKFTSLLNGGGGSNGEKKRQAAKEALFSTIEGLNRGVNANEEQKEAVDKAARALEQLNPNKQSLSSDQVNGEWELIYTTSASILGTGKLPPFRPWGPIYQTIDAVNLRARNRETWPFFNSVEAELTPTNATNVNVQFKLFRIFGLLPVTAPESAKGQLDTTYVDSNLRVSRGDKGNLFVLVMSNPEERLFAPAAFIQISNGLSISAFVSVTSLALIGFVTVSGMARAAARCFSHTAIIADKEALLTSS